MNNKKNAGKLQSLDAARKREVEVYAEGMGFGIASHGCHMTKPDPNCDGAFLAMPMILAQSGAQ